MSFRIGLGYDVHPFDDQAELILGGVKIPHDKGLKGHSDADVLLHAVIDALLGAVALGDIGTHFPDTDPAYKGADSAELIQACYDLVKQKGYVLTNTDVTVVTELPKLNPYISKIRIRISELLQCEPGRISVKATTSEKMGFVGRQEGIAVHAVVLLEKMSENQ